jgi:serine/threonine-protein kinase
MNEPNADNAEGRARPGTTLGTYRIERLLGRGGMGAVFLAYDTTLHRPVALKVVEAPSDGGSARSSVLREARNAAALNHPNICTIHEVGEANGSAFIAMEYVEGRSLRDRLDEGALPLEDAVRFGIQAAEALAYAHDHGVVHRDFKAANAIVTEAGRLKVVDFGLARRVDALMAGATTMPSIVPAGAAAGTPYAMAPEQVRGDSADARTDIWALGVLLYEMVAGAKPFGAATLHELFSSILRDSPAPLPDAVPVEMRVVIERCLDQKPERRYQHADEVRAALSAIQAATVPPWVAWRYHLNRRRGLVAAASLLGIGAVLAGFNVGGMRDRLGGNPPTTAPIKLAVLPFENLTGDPEQEYFSDGLTDEMITQLGRLHPQRLSVIARTSTMGYKNRATPIAEIGRELGVDYVLEGSARREGSRVRINATLIQVSDQTQRWADSYDRELAGVLAMQHDVARGVASALVLTLLPAEQTRLANARRVDPAAYEAYLKGSAHAARLTPADLDVALRYFELALESDPDYALAYTGIYRVWASRQQLVPALRREADPNRRAALAKALDLDEALPEVHHALAGQAMTDWDWTAAEQHYRRSIDLNPSFAEARAFYSQYLNMMKRPEEAMQQIEHAIELDPLNPTVQTFYGLALNNAKRGEEAIVQFRNVLRTTPDSGVALTGLQGALLSLGRKEEALDVQRKQAAARGDSDVEGALPGGNTEGGSDAALRRAIEVLEARWRAGGNANEVNIALLYLRLGEYERALDWLERAYEVHNLSLPSISNRNPFNPLRDHPRFQALLRRMNLP